MIRWTSNIIVLAAMASVTPIAPAQALTAQECSAKYQAAKTAGSLNGQTWRDFRKQQCGADGAAAEAKTDTKTDVKTEPPAATAKPAVAAAAAGAAVFPSAIDPKYAKEKASQARIHTCADQWKANKASNSTGGLRWLQKGGGYWSECNKRLKGA